jgi:phosphate transport system substrate-binding protein
MLLAVFIFLLVYGIWLNGNNPGDDNPNTDGNTDLLELDPGDVGGDLFVKTDAFSDGFVQSISSDFESAGFGGSLGLTAFPDSYEALDAFCNGSSDVVITMVWLDAENCAAAGDSQLIEMWVAYSALAIVVHPDNDWVDSLSMDDLDELFGYAENWSDLDSDWPESTVWRYFPSRDTSEFQAFVNTVLSGDADLLLNLDHIVEGGDMLDQDALLEDVYGIGFMSYQVYVDGDQALELAPIDDVIPDIDTVSNIDYPLAQPMILYTTSAALNDRPQVAAYVSYLLDVANEYAAGYGFTPMTEREYDHNLTLLQEAMGFE